MIKPYYKDDSVTLYCADCREVLPHLPKVDLVLTDPPYGINADKGVGGFGTSKARKYNDNWDLTRPDKDTFLGCIDAGKSAIIFGGQFFCDILPMSGHWIVWDKVGEMEFKNPFGDCELAWTNINRKSVVKHTVIQQGFVAEEKTRYHPTQKPVKLFELIIPAYSNGGDTILDPFAGSGTTGVAAKALGRKAILIEMEEKYCEIIVKRLAQDYLPM